MRSTQRATPRRAARAVAGAVMMTAVLLCPGPQARAGDAAGDGDFRYEGDFRYQIAAGVSAYELWYSSEDLILSPTGAVIRYFKFDWESAPRDREWIAQGVVLAGTAETGSTPVAVRLWAKERSRLQAELSRALSGARGLAVAVFTPSLAECPDEAACAVPRLQITADRAGDVHVGTVKVGTVKVGTAK